jgi:hypothetical protein
MFPQYSDWGPWVWLRGCMKALGLKALLKSACAQGLSLLLVIVSSYLVIFNYVVLAAPEDYLTLALRILYYLALGEHLLKCLGLGLKRLTRFSEMFDVLFVAGGLLTLEVVSPQLEKLLMGVQLARLYRLGQVATLLELYFDTKINLRFLHRFKKFITCAFMACLIVLKMLPILILICVVFGAIGIMAFYTEDHRNVTQYMYLQDANFESWYGILLVETTIMIRSGYSLLWFDIGERFGYLQSLIYFFTNHLFIVHVLIALLRGQCWEVYTAVESQLNEHNKRNNERINVGEAEEGDTGGLLCKSRSSTIIKQNEKATNLHLLFLLFEEFNKRAGMSLEESRKLIEIELGFKPRPEEKPQPHLTSLYHNKEYFRAIMSDRGGEGSGLVRDFLERHFVTLRQVEHQSEATQARYEDLMLNQIRNELKIKQKIRRIKTSDTTQELEMLAISERNEYMFLTFNSSYILKRLLLGGISEDQEQLMLQQYFESLYPSVYKNEGSFVLSSYIKAQAKLTESINWLLISNPESEVLLHYTNAILGKLALSLLPQGSRATLFFSSQDLLEKWVYLRN